MNRRMRKSIFLSFLILSYVRVLSVLAIEDSTKLAVHVQDFKPSKSIMSRKETEGYNNGRDNIKNDADKHDHHAVFPEKAQKAKGSYGGANMVHRRPTEKSAAPPLQSTCILISLSVSILCLFCLPVFPCLIV